MNVTPVPDEWLNANRVSFGDVRRRLDGASLAERSAILEFIRSNPNRVRPAMDDDWLYDSMSLYFLDCISLEPESNANDASIHSPFEAAHELVEWFNWFVVRDDNPTAIQDRIERIAAVFKNGNHSVRNCIETGFLEHVLEMPRNRPYFAHWNDDEILAESHTEALRWGKAHTLPNTQ